jgi:hypothetical protein
MDKVIAKFKVVEIGRQYWNQNAQIVKLNAVSGGAEGSENRSFSEATPSGHAEILVTNPAVADSYELGGEYYLTFEKATQPKVEG